MLSDTAARLVLSPSLLRAPTADLAQALSPGRAR